MELHIFRVSVGGFFGTLDDDTRRRLLAEADAHDVINAAFRRDGTLTYDRTLTSFRFRYEIRERGESSEEAEAAAFDTARVRAVEDLARLGVHGIDPAKLRVSGTDMATMWRR